jgi:hypothetical protein
LVDLTGISGSIAIFSLKASRAAFTAVAVVMAGIPAFPQSDDDFLSISNFLKLLICTTESDHLADPLKVLRQFFLFTFQPSSGSRPCAGGHASGELRHFGSQTVLLGRNNQSDSGHNRT